MQLKTLPEDFIVEEILNLNLEKERQDYSIARLTKKGWDHFKLIQKISKILNLKPKFIGYAGIKDKQAITTQYISFYKVSKEKINKIKIQDFSLEFLGYSKERINLGDLKGNNFKIIVRNLTKKVDIPKDIQIENYFDDQRFGGYRPNLHLVGKSILEKNLVLADNSGYKKKVKINDNFFRFLGFWIGDGFTNNYHNTERVGLLFNAKTEKKLCSEYKKIIEKNFKIKVLPFQNYGNYL